MSIATHLASRGNPFVVKTSKTQILWILYDLEWLRPVRMLTSGNSEGL